MNTKQITFEDKEYTVPSFVSWIARHVDGSITGHQYEPYEIINYGGSKVGYESAYGQSCTIYSPRTTMKLVYVGEGAE